ncbi:MAG: ABC-type transport auxiliary lipoprotein component, partial [Candidatus Binatota bacterium]|nr:ABC-type transport auxiliary lipoprotein component [Candidatus Binatota bacterium]
MRTRRFLPFAALALAGCSLARAVPDTHYYTLALPGTPRTKLSGRVAIVSLTADAPYATAPIVYRSSEYQLDYYTYHRWAADPREVVANA